MIKANYILSCAILLIFGFELLSISITDYSNNRGTSKGMVLFSFIFLYIWWIIPSFVYLIISKSIKGKVWVNWLFLILNGAILIHNIPMFIVYMKDL
jgi:hypothetical protein